MKKVISLFLILLAFPSVISAEDIHTMPWGMYQNNASHTGFLETTIDDKAFSFDWKTFVGTGLSWAVYYHSQPVVEGDLVYVYSSIGLQALSIHDGHKVWLNESNKSYISSFSVENGIVYFQTINSSTHNPALYGYDSKTGKIIFESLITVALDIYLAPTVFDGQVYVGGADGMYSFNARTGNKNWFSTLLKFDYSTPAVNKQFAISYSYGNLNVLDRLSGNINVKIKDSHYQWNETSFAPVLISDNEVLGVQSGYLSLFNIANQNIAWSKGPGYIGQPAFDGKFIYSSRNDGLYVLDKNGKVAWNWYQDNENVLGQILVTKNLVFISTDKNIYAISKVTREPVWSYPASGVLSMGMGHLYILDKLGNLISIKVSSLSTN